jgi:RimJ/RimL family protein N-acetyltransferase
LPESSSSTTKSPERFASWGDRDEREVTYWIGRSYWGRRIATGTLKAFLTVEADSD